MKEIGIIEGGAFDRASAGGQSDSLAQQKPIGQPSDLESRNPLPPTQDDDLWLEATIEETESEWWL